MVAFLSDDWFARVASCDGGWLADVADAVFQIDVAGSPDGALPWHVQLAGGAVASCGRGPAASPDIVLSLSWADAKAIAADDLDANAAYMLGRVKTEGETGPLVALLKAMQLPDARQARARLAADTEF